MPNLLLVLSLLGAALLAYSAVFGRMAKTAPNSTVKPPVFFSWVPLLGPIYNIATKGSNQYISSLCSTQRSTIATLRLPGQDMHLVHPLDSPTVKNFTKMRHLSLMAVFHVAVGPAMGCISASDKFLTQPDTGEFKKYLSKLFNGELRNLQNLQKYAAQLEKTIDIYWDIHHEKKTAPAIVGLGAWSFDMLSYAMGAVFWGEEGPFEEQYFRERLRLFIQNLESLRNPIKWLIPAEIRSARDYVRRRIDQSVENEAYGTPAKQDATLFSRLAHLYEAQDIPREGFTDCHLVAIVGLLSNVINMITWGLCRVIADEHLHERLLAEVRAAIEDQQSPNLTLDADNIRASCPLLVATWYELLRTYGDSPVARLVYEDSIFDNRYELKKGSIVMTPIHLHNFDEGIWGAEKEEFRPARFIQADGQINKELVQHLTVFGLPGMHQCPGRYLALTMFLALMAKTLLQFDMCAAPGENFSKDSVPGQKASMLGLPSMNRDPKIVLSRHEDVETVRILFQNVKPGW